MYLKNYIQLNIKNICRALFLLKILDEIKNFFKIHKKVILKPIHSYSGNDIHLIK